jgi:hypothetical protein
MLTLEHRQEALSWAYLEIIAARCGFSCSSPDFDYGMDVTIHDILQHEGRYVESGFKLDVQLKSTTTAILTPTHVLYDLAITAYNDLRVETHGLPRILVLLVLPSEENEWTAQSEDCVELRRCAYWASLRGMKATKNKRAIRISIPRINVFSIESLRSLMDRIRRKEVIWHSLSGKS